MLVKIPRQIIRRMCEYDADHGSLLLTNDPEAIKSNFLKMKEEREAYRLTKKPIPSTDSLANTDTKLLIPAPNPTLSSPLSPIKTLLQSHPSFDKRIAYIEKLQKQMEDKSSEKTI
jgi:Zn-dependent protease with chaperone function